jgi:hypothetical protein
MVGTTGADAQAVDGIRGRIFLVRSHKVLLDSDLAAIYGVTTKRFNEQVRRNLRRFPDDFAFRLSPGEWNSLRSQFATLKKGRGEHRKHLPLAFTEHGAIMAAAILNSARAIQVSVYVVRAFVRLRELLTSDKEFARRLDDAERRLGSHDQAIVSLVNTVRTLVRPSEPKRRPIGFVTPQE